MTTTMVGPAMLTVLIHIFLVSHGVWSWEPDGAGAEDLPWQDELCCDSAPAHLPVEAERSASSPQHRPRCSFRSSTTPPASAELSHGTCLGIVCRLDESRERLTCDMEPYDAFPLSAWHMTVSSERVLSPRQQDSGDGPDDIVVCQAEDSTTCSVALTADTASVSVLLSSNSTALARPVRLRVPVKPSRPVNLSHNQTIEPELILRWDPPKNETRPLIYEVRYAPKETPPDWKEVPAITEPRLALDLEPHIRGYSIQVRCASAETPALWSDWSETYYMPLSSVTYIPEVMIVRPGETATVYCVFNNRNANASTAVWTRNFDNRVHSSKYQAVNQWVSKVTLQPSQNQMLDVLHCRDGYSYSSVYIEGASIDITCTTNGDMDRMKCQWENPGMYSVSFNYRVANTDCDDMEKRERDGEKVEVISSLKENASAQAYEISPLWMNCYKVWLEMQPKLGPVRSKPVYLSPKDHVKPHSPTSVKAVSQSDGFLNVSWTAPPLPIHCRCQFQYRTMSTGRPQWKVQREVLASHAVARVDHMCRVHEVQVRCKPEQGTGEWSDWTNSTFSIAQNDNAPERGPDFWRILRDYPDRNQTLVTLLLRPVQISGAHCVDGVVVRRRASNGSVTSREIEVTDTTHSFDWDHSPQTVTVEAYNNLGTSAHNFHMTLDRQPKGRCVQSFSVLVINNTFVSLSWSLLDNSSRPVFMVVQWFPQKQQDSDHRRGQSREPDSWARLPHVERPTYLRGDFFGPEEYDYYLYPVLAEGECEPVHATATRRDPAAYMLLLIVSFLSVVLFVSLLLSQNQMKKFVWKDVPNPNNCSWAKGVDFKKADNFDPLFRATDGIPAWPLFPSCENISNVVIVDKTDLSALTTALIQPPTVSVTVEPSACIALPQELDQTSGGSGSPPLAPGLDAQTGPGSADSSGQSSVTYATVLLSDPRREQLPIHLHGKDTSGSSSSDEGNFSSNNTDISGSLHGGLWELDNPRRSCSCNSVEKLSETSGQGDEDEDEDEGVREEKELYYLGMDYPAEDEESGDEEDEEQGGTELLKAAALTREARSELHPLLGPEGGSELLSAPTCGLSPLYLPQFRTVQPPQDAV